MTQDISAPELQLEHYVDPTALGIGEARPRLSWIISAAPTDYRQDAYEVRWNVLRPNGTVADTGSAVVDSDEQLFVSWPASPLRSRYRAEVAVRTRDAATGQWGLWSETRVVERGLSPEDWGAKLVGPGYPEDQEQPEARRRAPLLRTDFELPADVNNARLHMTAHGLVQLELNGVRVGHDELVPGWTPYNDRLRVYTYDVTELLHEGSNVLGAWLADGWYRGRIGFEGGTTDIYGDKVGLLAQLEVQMAGGLTSTIISSEEWTSAPGPLTRASLYDGECLDMRLYPQGWSEPGFDDYLWHPVDVQDIDYSVLAAPDGPPVRCTQQLEPVSITRVDDGWLIDYGQNHSGRPRVKVPAASTDAHVTIEHAEVLQEGRIYQRPLRQAAATDEIITTGDPVDWEPRFTVHGYRYAFVTGWPTKDGPQAGDIVSRVLHSDMERTGWFSSDRADLNRLHENVVWGLRSNFVDIPTDCPQRDERLGWTGDVQLFTPSASFLYDVYGVLSDWLRTLDIEQRRFGGTVPVYVPWVPGGDWWHPTMDVAGWGDAAVLVPAALYRAFADPEILARQFESARTWVDKVTELAGSSRLWNGQRQLGDWLDPTAPPERPMEAITDPNLVATAYFAHSVDTLAEIAQHLGMAPDHNKYRQLFEETRRAYGREYVNSSDPSHDTVCAHSLAIAFGLIPDAHQRAMVGDRLAEIVRAGGYRVATGFLGTPVVTDALTETGHLDDAYRMVLNYDGPSWMATVALGATTMWERWDSLLPDGTVNPGDMTSFNHYALGSVADWIHRVVGGLSPLEPGYRRLLIAPRPGPGVQSAEVRLRTPYGVAAVSWILTGEDLHVTYTVPVGATAVVDLPGCEPCEAPHGTFTVLAHLGDVSECSASGNGSQE